MKFPNNMGTKYQGTEEEKLSLNAYIALIRSTDSIGEKIISSVAKSKLTISQFGVLECLFHLGPLCQKEISEKILKSTANITTVIDNLEKRELVKRVRQENDRRYITVQLTSRGKSMIEKILPEHLKQIIDTMNILSSSERKDLHRLCKKLGLKKQKN
ncbi:MAG: MarR family transcriptional regulator [Leptospiraceae bacterium]|nr:MarR family transcriptional regulator [Leptospiraceae bacterium]